MDASDVTADNNAVSGSAYYVRSTERFVLLGLSAVLRVVVVVHALRGEDVIRIRAEGHAPGDTGIPKPSAVRHCAS